MLYFLAVPPQLSLTSNRLIAEEKQNVTIACTATGQPLPSITWSRSVGSLPEDRTEVKSGSLIIYSVTRQDGGTYICKAENILGTATDTAKLVIFSPLRFKVGPPQEVTPVIGSGVHLPCQAHPRKPRASKGMGREWSGKKKKERGGERKAERGKPWEASLYRSFLDRRANSIREV